MPIPTMPQTKATRPDKFETTAAVFRALGFALSARLLLLLSLIGAFVLGVEAMSMQTMMGLYVLAAYCCFTVLPVTYLEVSKRRIE
jgi:hypothetical protein